MSEPLTQKFRIAVLIAALCSSGACATGTPKEEKLPSGVLETLDLLRGKSEIEKKEAQRLSQMVLVPAGGFTMGSDRYSDDEKPAHRVTLDAFYMNRYEVTQLQYQLVMRTDPSYFRNCPLCPVEKVTFDEAAAYCDKVGKRLPTEAEWEKAAKGGTEGPFYWGDDFPEEFAWEGNNSERRTQPVGRKKPNGYGLYDMAGNVFEWVQDWYDENYYRISPDRNPKGPAQGKRRVVRGGTWGHVPELLRHSHRESFEPDARNITGGFRCAADAIPGKP